MRSIHPFLSKNDFRSLHAILSFSFGISPVPRSVIAAAPTAADDPWCGTSRHAISHAESRPITHLHAKRQQPRYYYASNPPGTLSFPFLSSGVHFPSEPRFRRSPRGGGRYNHHDWWYASLRLFSLTFTLVFVIERLYPSIQRPQSDFSPVGECWCSWRREFSSAATATTDTPSQPPQSLAPVPAFFLSAIAHPGSWVKQGLRSSIRFCESPRWAYQTSSV